MGRLHSCEFISAITIIDVCCLRYRARGLGVHVSNPFFDSLNSILSNKKYWWSKETEGEYAPVGVTIGLSQHLDAILYVNEVNIWWRNLSPRMHYDFLFYTIRKMHRSFPKWAKKVTDDDLLPVMQTYQVSRDKATDILKLLTPEQLKEVKDYATL